jgi:hypothetical protein
MAGAAKPGSTLPPQGGKGGVQSPRPTLAPPGQGSTLPPQGGKGGVQPGQVPPRTLGGYSPADIDRLMANQVPAQVQQPAPGQVPAQGGKAQNPDGTRTGTLPGYAQPYVNSMLNQPQVPAQGGKAPLTPEQHAAISANADPARGLGLNLGDMLYGGGGQQPQVQPQVQQPAPVMPAQPQRDLGYGIPPPRPQVFPAQPQRDLGYGIPPPRPQVFPAQPQVMPRPVPQVMPRQPTPKPAPQVMPRGLAGLRGRR